MLRLLIYVILGYLIWKIVRILMFSGRPRVNNHPAPPDFPEDASFKHIQDADFKDVSSDPEKPS
jgi:hypothetical protein